MMIDYQLEADLSVEEFVDVLVRSTLAERRPVSDRATIRHSEHGVRGSGEWADCPGAGQEGPFAARLGSW
jgi:hypothetical protein